MEQRVSQDAVLAERWCGLDKERRPAKAGKQGRVAALPEILAPGKLDASTHAAVWQPTHAFAGTANVLYSALCSLLRLAWLRRCCSAPLLLLPPHLPPALCGERPRSSPGNAATAALSSARPSADLEISLEPRQRHGARAARLDGACALAALSVGGTRLASRYISPLTPLLHRPSLQVPLMTTPSALPPSVTATWSPAWDAEIRPEACSSG